MTRPPNAVPARSRITSRSNELIKFVRSLQQRKYRKESGRFMAEGLYFLLEALARGAEIETVLYTPEALANPAAAAALRDLIARGACVETTDEIMAGLSRRDNPQGLVLVLGQRWEPLPELAAGELWVALQGVKDPGNLGTIMRTGAAVGAAGILLIDDCCDPYSLEAVRASMGAIFAVRFCRAAGPEFLDWRQRTGATVIGTSLRAGREYRDAAYRLPLVLLMGNEQSGLPQALEQACDDLVRIPMRHGIDSLNLAVATSLMLYEAFLSNR